ATPQAAADAPQAAQRAAPQAQAPPHVAPPPGAVETLHVRIFGTPNSTIASSDTRH
ncbi:hypothetical protein L195_g049303, partial [Trifolium pratense]